MVPPGTGTDTDTRTRTIHRSTLNATYCRVLIHKTNIQHNPMTRAVRTYVQHNPMIRVTASRNAPSR